MRVVCIGDSITAGQHLRRAQPWPTLLGWDDVIAKGVNGDTTRLMLERFPRDVQDLEPNMVIIQAGHNDCNRWESDRFVNRVSVAAFEANLHEMIHRCLVFEAAPVLVSLTPTRKPHYYDLAVRHYNERLVNVAARRNIPLVDVRQRFLELGLDDLLLSDGLHPSAAGHRAYADCVQNALVRLQVAA